MPVLSQRLNYPQVYPAQFICFPASHSGPVSSASDPAELTALLKTSEISAHSFLLDPLGKQFDMHLFDEAADISQSHIESTVYLALAGTHVGLIPTHFADQWVRTGELVAIAPATYGVTSHFNAVRLKSAPPSDIAAQIWGDLRSTSSD